MSPHVILRAQEVPLHAPGVVRAALPVAPGAVVGREAPVPDQARLLELAGADRVHALGTDVTFN